MQQLRTGDLISEQYRILSFIGRGGWGDVFKAEQVSLGKVVAVKILHTYLNNDEEKLERFRREARLAGMIQHPYICPVFDFGVTHSGDTYYVMDFLEGRTLESILDEKKTLTAESAVPLFAKLCQALSAAHNQGILHRDLKPSNVIIRSNGDPVLLDFGLAKLRGEKSHDHLSLTAKGSTVGTPTFMSPEQSLGNAVDERTDIYSLGCMLYLALSGKPPFDAPAYLEVMRMHVREQPSPLKCAVETPANIVAAVMQSLQKNPNDRQQTAEEFRNQLLGAAESPPKPNTSSGKPKKKKVVALTAAASVLAVGAAAGGYYWSAMHTANNVQQSNFNRRASGFNKASPAQVRATVDAAYKRGDNDSLENNALKLVELYSDKQMPPEESARMLLNTQTMLINRGLYGAAEKACVAAIKRWSEIYKPGSPAVVGAEMELAQNYFLDATSGSSITGDWSYSPMLFHAEQLLDKVHQDVKAGGTRDLLGQVLMQQERLLDTEQRYRQAVLIGKECLPVVEQTSTDAGLKARAYLADGLAQGLTGNVDQSVKEYQRVIDLETLTDGKNSSEVANAYCAIGEMFETRNDLPKARHYFDIAEKLFQQLPLNDPHRASSTAVFNKWHFLEGVYVDAFYQSLINPLRGHWQTVLVQNPYESAFAADIQGSPRDKTCVVNHPGQPIQALTPQVLADCRTLDLAGTLFSDADLAALGKLPNLQRLSLMATNITDAAAPTIADFPDLQTLNLNVTRVGRRCAMAAAKLPHLNVLDLCTTQLNDSDLASIALCPSLQRLALQETRIGDAGAKYLSKNRTIKSLDMRATQLTDKGLRCLGAMPQLERLELKYNLMTGSGLQYLPQLKELFFSLPIAGDFTIAGVGGMKNLRVLQLPMTSARDSDISFLAQLTGLEELNLAGTDIGDDTIALVKQLPRLRKLNLNHTKITNRALASLAECKTLEELHIAQDGIKDISALAGMANLKVLSISDDPVDDSCIPTLHTLPRLSTLLINRTNMSPSAVLKLAHALPLKVLAITGIDVGVDGILELSKNKSCHYYADWSSLSPQERRRLRQGLSGIRYVTTAE